MAWILGPANQKEIDEIRKKGYEVQEFNQAEIRGGLVQEQHLMVESQVKFDFKPLKDEERYILVYVDSDIPDMMSNQWPPSERDT